MPCDTRLKPRQTISQRADEVRRMVAKLSEKLVQGLVRPVIGKNGAIAFDGLTEKSVTASPITARTGNS